MGLWDKVKNNVQGAATGFMVGGPAGAIAGGAVGQEKINETIKGVANRLKAPSAPKLDTTQIEGSQAGIQAAGQSALAAALARQANPTKPVQVTAPNIALTQTANTSPANLSTPEAQAAQLAPTQTINAAQIGNMAQANTLVAPTVDPVTGQVIAPVSQMQAAQLAPTQLAQDVQVAPAALVQGQSIEQQQQAELRAKQVALANALEGQAAGTQPSLAEAQMKMANDRAIAQQMAIAGASKGPVALAQRQAAMNTAALQQQNAQAAGALRLQEQTQAQEQLSNLLGTARSTDVGLATTQAQLGQQANLSNQGAINTASGQQAGLSQQTALANALAQNQAAQQQGQFQQQAGMVNTEAQNQQAQAQAQLSQQANLANQQTALSQAQQAAQLGTQVNLANQASQNQGILQQAELTQQSSLANQNAINQASQKQAELQQQAALQNRQMTSQEQQQYAQLQAQLDQFNAQQANLNAQQNAEMQQKSQIANQAAQLQAQGLDDAQIAKMMGLNQESLTAILASQTGIAQAKLAGKQAQSAQQNSLMGGLIGAAGSVGAAFMMSDENMKTNIKALSTDDDEEAKKRKEKQKALADVLSTKETPDVGSGIASAVESIGKAMAYSKNNPTPTPSTTSDKNMKTEIKAESPDKMGAFLDALKGYEYKYKNPEMEGAAPGQRYGILAQNLDATEVGKTIVNKDKGYLTIDVPQGLGVALAGLGEIHKRLKKLEGAK